MNMNMMNIALYIEIDILLNIRILIFDILVLILLGPTSTI